MTRGIGRREKINNDKGKREKERRYRMTRKRRRKREDIEWQGKEGEREKMKNNKGKVEKERIRKIMSIGVRRKKKKNIWDRITKKRRNKKKD